ncbi:MAG: hypothetical protein ACR2G5_13645 [Pyrinomonadaceae bacterium]
MMTRLLSSICLLLNVQAGYNHATAICMTVAAMHSGQRVTFDDAKQEGFVG